MWQVKKEGNLWSTRNLTALHLEILQLKGGRQDR